MCHVKVPDRLLNQTPRSQVMHFKHLSKVHRLLQYTDRTIRSAETATDTSILAKIHVA